MACAPPSLNTVSMPAELGGGEDGRVRTAVRARRRAKHALRAAGQLRGHAQHDGGRGKRARAGGHVQADRFDRAMDLLAAYARLGLERRAARGLRLVKASHVLDGALEGLQLGGASALRARELLAA